MSEKISYENIDDVALVTLDDGKANAFGHEFITSFNANLERAEKEAKATAIIGRPGLLSGGFDLSVINGGDALDLLARQGFDDGVEGATSEALRAHRVQGVVIQPHGGFGALARQALYLYPIVPDLDLLEAPGVHGGVAVLHEEGDSVDDHFV